MYPCAGTDVAPDLHAASRAAANVAASGKRSSGSFAIARVTTRSSGRAAATSADGTGGGAVMCASSTCAAVARG